MALLLIAVVPEIGFAQKKKNKNKNASSKAIEDRGVFVRKNPPTGLSAAQLTAFETRQVNDSLSAERWRELDSTIAARKIVRDSIAKMRKERTDSIAAVNKYKNSKKYLRMVEKAKQAKADSIKYARIEKLDKLKEEREARLDSIKKARQIATGIIVKERERVKDSTVASRTKIKELLEKQRKARTDSLAKVKKAREAALEKKRKLDLEKIKKGFKTEDEKQMAKAMELHQKKNEEFTNLKFLKKPWSLNRRIYQNTITRYNYYYNAKNDFARSLQQQAKNSKRNYTKLLDLEPYNPADIAGAVGGDMDSIIKKCATSIQIHDPRSKWFDNLFFLTGKAYYAKNDMENAIATFQYVANEYKDNAIKKKKKSPAASRSKKKEEIKPGLASKENHRGLHKLNHHSQRNDALLWMAKAYFKNENYSDARSMVSLLDEDKNFPRRLHADLYLLGAQTKIQDEQIADAIMDLQKINKLKKVPISKRQTAQFVLGQLLAKEGKYAESSVQFNKVLKSHAVLDMDFYARVYLAKNVASGNVNNMESVESMFQKVIKDGKYEAYLDRAYLALAQTIMQQKPQKAIEYFNKSINAKNANNDIKGEAFLNKGDLHFNLLQYELAKIAYDSALAFLPKTEDFNKADIEIRRDLLASLVTELNILNYNDSLIALSKMTAKEQKLIAKAALKLARKQAADTTNLVNTPTLIPSNSSKGNSKWYFGNPQTVAAGYKTFLTKYGNRPNVDGWIRKSTLANETGFEVSNANQTSNSDGTDNGEASEMDLQQYLDKIPKTNDQLTACNSAIENSLYNAALIYYGGLTDNKKTIEYLEKLISRYPETSYQQKSYYTLFLANSKLHNMSEAEKWSALLRKDFPNSSFARLAGDSTYLNAQRDISKTIEKYYNDSYDLYAEKKFGDVASRSLFAVEAYPTSALRPKFELLGIMSAIELNKKEQAKDDLNAFITQYAGSEEATFAQDILALLLTKLPKQQDSSNTSIANINTSFDNKNLLSDYAFDAKAPHLFLIVVKKIDARLESMRSGMNDYNAINYSLENLENTFYLINQQTGVCAYKTFNDRKKAETYKKELQKNKKIYAMFKDSELEMCLISADNYELFKNTRNLEGYLKFYRKNYK